MTSFFDWVEGKTSLLKAELYKWHMDKFGDRHESFAELLEERGYVPIDYQFDAINELDRMDLDDFVEWFEYLKRKKTGYIYIAYTYNENNYLVDYTYFLKTNMDIIEDSNANGKYVFKLEIKNPENIIDKIYDELATFKRPGTNRGWYQADDVKALIAVIEKVVKANS